ncbi:MAG: LysR family transcriptional regulator [Gammaproteobacteria bacterium]|nr:LysR family transcriptional regulator [Gammaproteobacteria bacterium]
MIAATRLRNLDLATIRSFVTITETGSMTRAAARLHMTQSAISMQIKRLEDNLGFSVFDRASQGMSPTSEGEQLLQFARQLLALNDEAIARLTLPDYEGVIRIAAPSDVVYPHIPNVFKEFSRDFPRVQVRFSTGSTIKLLRDFGQGLHDIVITTERNPGKNSEILLTQPLIWTGAKEGAAWKRRPLPIGFTRHCIFRSAVSEALDEAGIPWISPIDSEDDLAVEAMISADLCVHAELNMVDSPNRTQIDHAGQLPPLPAYSIALYHDALSGNPVLDSLVEYLKRAYR